MGFLAGKRLLITGVLSNRSIAYGIARACHREGAELAFSYQGERFKERISEFAAEFGSSLVYDCDVTSDEQMQALFDQLGEVWPEFDGFVHSIGFAPREAIAGSFLDGLTRENFRIAHDISAYSFPAMAKLAAPRLRPGAALLTLSYLGAERFVPNYNTMGLAKAALESSVRYLAYDLGAKGVRVNGISAGPIKTLAASGIKDFGKLLAGISQASQVLVQDSQTVKLDKHLFNGAYLMHTSTSPQYSIIASCDVAAAMMEPPGGTALVEESIKESLDFRRAMRKVDEDYGDDWWFKVWGPEFQRAQEGNEPVSPTGCCMPTRSGMASAAWPRASTCWTRSSPPSSRLGWTWKGALRRPAFRPRW